MTWREQLDEIFPEPGIDLAILDDPDQVDTLVRRAMAGAWSRLVAPREDLDLVLDALLAPSRS